MKNIFSAIWDWVEIAGLFLATVFMVVLGGIVSALGYLAFWFIVVIAPLAIGFGTLYWLWSKLHP